MKNILFVICFVMTVSVSAQQDFIRGKLLDADTDEPIAFATVRVKGKYKGVISNADGSFRIPQIFKEYGDTLEISSMGYRTLEKRIVDLSPENINILKLEEGVFELREAVVVANEKKGLRPRQIVRRAIRNIPENYPSHSFSNIGYYRDYQKDEEKYVNLNEAILEVFDAGFGTSDSSETKIKIYDYARNTNFGQDSSASISYDYVNYRKTIDNAYLPNRGGNEFSILRVHDAIRNHNIKSFSFIERFDKDLLRNHNFSKASDTYWNGENLYTIKFNKTYPKYKATGILYIGKDDYAIVKLKYAVYDKKSKDASTQKSNSDRKKKLVFEVDTEYQRAYDKLYLNYISFHNTFRIALPPILQVNHVTVDLKREIFVIYFNQNIEKSTAQSLKNYDFKYRNKKLAFRNVNVIDNKIELDPEMSITERQELFSEVSDILDMEPTGKKERIHNKMSKILKTDVEGIEDVNGNVLGEVRYKYYNQFREFFVQELKPKTSVPEDTLLMKKNRPIFGEQPILKPENFDEYWMNTPLKTTTE